MNACTRKYGLAFNAKHGMRCNKAVLGSPVQGARANRPQYGHYFSGEGLVGEAFFRLFLLL
jgi:hypothetical protein